jgi:hypothetical protein
MKKILIGFGAIAIVAISFVNINFSKNNNSSEVSVNALLRANQAQAECDWSCKNIYYSCCWSPYNAMLW